MVIVLSTLFLLGLLLATPPLSAFAQQAPIQSIGSLEVRVDCSTNPEVTAIVNNTQRSFNLNTWTIGSIYQPRPNEPFSLTGSLEPGTLVQLQTGRGAPAGQEQNIYEDNVSAEGVRVTTEFGVMEVLCSQRAYVFELGIVSAATTPNGTRVNGMPRTGHGALMTTGSRTRDLAVLSGMLLLVSGFTRRLTAEENHRRDRA